jgi:histone deacetylase 11
MLRIVYSRKYNIGFFGLERLHPFDSRKYGRAYRVLRKHFGARLKSLTVSAPYPITREELLDVHAEYYLDSLRRPAVVARALELAPLRKLPAWLIDWCVLRPMRWATMGTVEATMQALAYGLAVNLGGGYHHAKPAAGEGFCVYADVAAAVHQMRNSEELSAEEDRVAHIDLDAHQGNGVAYCFKNDPRVFLFDMYNEGIYPAGDRAALDRVDLPVPLRPGCDGDSYLRILRDDLPRFLDSVGRSRRLALAVYNAGTDVYEGDPLGRLGLSAGQILERDLFVIDLLRRRGVPTVMVLSGGYHHDSYRLVAETVKHLIERYAGE